MNPLIGFVVLGTVNDGAIVSHGGFDEVADPISVTVGQGHDTAKHAIGFWASVGSQCVCNRPCGPSEIVIQSRADIGLQQ
ncbi:MAG: hypothetical protein AAGC71_03740 [Pseudomonadota bacterium]